jgi:hypothetical protein
MGIRRTVRRLFQVSLAPKDVNDLFRSLLLALLAAALE